MKKFIKNIKIFVFIFLKKRGFHPISKFDKSFFDGVILSFFAKKPKDSLFKIIQVGACVGSKKTKNSLDPLVWFVNNFGSEISILYIEPQISLKEDLIRNTKGLCSENFYEFVAISKNKGNMSLYVPNPSYFPNSLGIASLHESNVLKRLKVKCKNPVLGKHYYKNVVELKNLTEVSKVFNKDSRNNSSNKICDFLVIDAEGHDDEVIYSIEDPETLPNAISFEWKNLSNEKFKKLSNFLEENHYTVHKYNKADCIAIKIKKIM